MNIVAALIKWFIFVGTYHVMNLFVHFVCIKKNKSHSIWYTDSVSVSVSFDVLSMEMEQQATFGIDDQCQGPGRRIMGTPGQVRVVQAGWEELYATLYPENIIHKPALWREEIRYK
jgi:hypothetical protein